jgi:hypothetical protein
MAIALPERILLNAFPETIPAPEPSMTEFVHPENVFVSIR